MASREFSEIERFVEIAERGIDVAVGVIDVKSYYIESPSDVAERVRLCLEIRACGKLSFAPDCGLSQTARWAAKQRLANMVSGVAIVPERAWTHVIRALQTHDALYWRTFAPPTGTDGGVRLWWLGQSGFLLQWQRHPCATRSRTCQDSLTKNTAKLTSRTCA